MDNIIIGNDDAHHQQLLQEAQQQINIEERIKLNTILDRRDAFPFRTRNKIDVLVTEYLDKLKDDIHGLICNEKDYTLDVDSYQGLDSERDTEAEVETALRFFPDVLGMEFNGRYPIHWISFLPGYQFPSCNLKAVTFIYLFARLAIELNYFMEEERGGLLCEDGSGNNVFHRLMLSDCPGSFSQDHNELVDNKYLQVLIQLRQTGLLVRNDIQDKTLVRSVLSNSGFSERRFQFLVEWDPTVLLQFYNMDTSPLHHAANHSSIHVFRIIFEYCIQYYPNKKGIQLLFRKAGGGEFNNGYRPFKIACAKFGRKEVIKVVEDTLIRYSSSSSLDNNDNNNNGTTPPPPLNIVETVLTAAIDENVHLDCIYFLIQREPDILMKLLPQILLSRSESESESKLLTANTMATVMATATATANTSSTSTSTEMTATTTTTVATTTATATATGDGSTTTSDNDDDNNHRNGVSFSSRTRRRKKRKKESREEEENTILYCTVHVCTP